MPGGAFCSLKTLKEREESTALAKSPLAQLEIFGAKSWPIGTIPIPWLCQNQRCSTQIKATIPDNHDNLANELG